MADKIFSSVNYSFSERELELKSTKVSIEWQHMNWIMKEVEPRRTSTLVTHWESFQVQKSPPIVSWVECSPSSFSWSIYLLFGFMYLTRKGKKEWARWRLPTQKCIGKGGVRWGAVSRKRGVEPWRKALLALCSFKLLCTDWSFSKLRPCLRLCSKG